MRGRPLRSRVSAVATCSVLSVGTLAGMTAAGEGVAAATPALTTVTAYFNPGSADAASVEYAQKAGIFAKYGLNVKFEYSDQGGPQIVPALSAGKVQFGEPGVEDTIVATAKGIPLEMIGSVDVAAPTGPADWTVDLVLKSSPIKSVCQLPGKSVAVNSLLGLGQLYVDADYYSAHCVETPRIRAGRRSISSPSCSLRCSRHWSGARSLQSGHSSHSAPRTWRAERSVS